MGRFITVILVLLLIGCRPYDEKEVTITKDYVINPNWDKQNNSFQITEMNLKEEVGKNINPMTATSYELLNNLVKDKGQQYFANVTYNGLDYSQRKVYFNRDNGFLWLKDLYDSNSAEKVLGSLKKETWYLLGGLSNVNTLYYVYIDSSGKLHKVRVPASDWTNI